ncbi:DUF397 domain-containing protein [Marinactinospora rubrisoli]|uniref:DUF397 domain-containing protein n=1 Tax=Marinactinospora rubrisoli TaxID=2715399 RepID=A0ABW2KA61_9ACTN
MTASSVTSPELVVANADWEDVCDQAVAGHHTIQDPIRSERTTDGGPTLTTPDPGSPTLTFTRAEVDAFRAGVRNGELRSHALAVLTREARNAYA